MENQQYLDCPDCGSKIPFDPYALVRGARFNCPQCHNVSIGLDPSSQAIVEDTLNKFDNLKKNIGKMPPGQSSASPI